MTRQNLINSLSAAGQHSQQQCVQLAKSEIGHSELTPSHCPNEKVNLKISSF